MTAAIIDIGSNSIKILVATRNPCGQAVALFYKTIEARISAGISKASPALSTEGMSRGLAAIQELLADAERFAPDQIIMVATSAVRDASNGEDFRGRVFETTGHEIRILNGDEEANYIGRGLTCDPALGGLRDFYVFDLGGGSLECLAFHNRRMVGEKSFQLGCVRLTEKFVADPALPFSDKACSQVMAHTQETLRNSNFAFALPPETTAIATGGTITTARAMLGASVGKTLNETSSWLTVAELRELLGHIGKLTLEDRRKIPGMPPGRADVFPTALATILALADFAGFPAFETSLYNLRWGIAAEVLQINL